jgi:hypothetical protein
MAMAATPRPPDPTGLLTSARKLSFSGIPDKSRLAAEQPAPLPIINTRARIGAAAARWQEGR